MTKPNGERIAAMEQRMIDFSNKLVEVGQDVKEVKNMVQTKLSDHIIMFDRITQIEKDLVKLQSQSFLWRWLSPTLAAIFGGTIMFLVTEYFKTH